MPKTQPILDELHAVRERLLAESGGTLSGLVARLRAEQAKSGREILKAIPPKEHGSAKTPMTPDADQASSNAGSSNR
jgi:hypothetical protein